VTDSDRLRELGAVPEPRRGGLLIRHAHIPTSNAQEDPPLTEAGLEQAQALAGFLAREAPLAAVYSSPLRRALQTAEPVARAQGLPVQTDARLRELDIDLPAGTTLREALGEEAWQRHQRISLHDRRWDPENPYYEAAASIRARVWEAVEAFIEAHRGGRVAVVAHSPVLNAYVARLLGTEIDLVYSPRLTSVSVVHAREDIRRLRTLNSLAHLQTL
jgi:probable phosphoglycerate mutase